jgi:hypothetical protein
MFTGVGDGTDPATNPDWEELPAESQSFDEQEQETPTRLSPVSLRSGLGTMVQASPSQASTKVWG